MTDDAEQLAMRWALRVLVLIHVASRFGGPCAASSSLHRGIIHSGCTRGLKSTSTAIHDSL